MKKNLLAMTVMLCALFSAFQLKANVSVTYNNPGYVQAPVGTNHQKVLGITLANDGNQDVKIPFIQFEFIGSQPELIFMNLELYSTSQLGSLAPSLVGGAVYYNLGSSLILPAGTSIALSLYSDIQWSCSGGNFTVNVMYVSTQGMTTLSQVPVTGLSIGTGWSFNIIHPITVTLDSIPNTVCPNVPFTPHAIVSWNDGMPCTSNLTYDWNFTFASTIQYSQTLAAPTIEFNQSGTYTINLTVHDTATNQFYQGFYTVIVLPSPTGYIQTQQGQLNCLTDTVTLTASLQNAQSFYWNYNGAYAGNNLTVSATQAGNYTLHATNSNGCGDLTTTFPVYRDTFAIQLLWNGQNADSIQICPEQQTSFYAQLIGTNYQSLTYEWSDGTNLNYMNNATVGEYKVIATNFLGCSSADSITVTERQVTPPTLTAQGPTQFCAGGSLLITATPGYQWQNWTGGYTSLSRDSILVMWDSEITLTAQDSFGCMVQSNTILVDVVNGPGTPTITQNGCELVSNFNGNNLQWYVNGGQIVDSTQVIIPQISGLYTVMVTNEFGCSSTSEQLAYAMPALPVISTNGSTQLCIGESVLLTVQPGFNFLWSNGATTQSILVNQPGTYTATVTNGTCIQTASPISVTVTNCNQSPSGQINLFYATPNNVCSGSSVNLTWATANAISGQFSTDHPIGGNPFAFAFTQVVSVIVYQTTTFTLTIQDGNLNSHSQTIVVHVDTCTTTGTNDIEAEAAIKLYPNPSTTTITVENIPDGVTNYSIVSVTGQVLAQTETAKAINTTIDVSSFASGIYFLKFDNGATKKFIKE
jgi:hypothetical protein